MDSLNTLGEREFNLKPHKLCSQMFQVNSALHLGLVLHCPFWSDDVLPTTHLCCLMHMPCVTHSLLLTAMIEVRCYKHNSSRCRNVGVERRGSHFSAPDPPGLSFPRFYCLTTFSRQKTLPISHFETRFLTIQSQTGQEGLCGKFHVGGVFR